MLVFASQVHPFIENPSPKHICSTRLPRHPFLSFYVDFISKSCGLPKWDPKSNKLHQTTFIVPFRGIPFFAPDLFMHFGRHLGVDFGVDARILPRFARNLPRTSWSTIASIHFPHLHTPGNVNETPDRKDTKSGGGGDWPLATFNY